MRIAAAISATLHIAVFAIAWIGVLPSSKPLLMPAPAIDVEIATEPELTKPKAEAKPEPKRKPPPPPSPPKRAPSPEPEVAVKAEPEPVPAPKPPKVVPKPKPKPKVEKQAKPKPKKTVRRPMPRPKAKPKPPPKHDFASVLKTVSKLEKKKPPPKRKPEKKAETKKKTTAPLQQVADALKRTRPQPQLLRASSGLTASELNAIQRHIEPCWNLPAGARDADTMVVEIRATLNPDGRVRSAVIVDTVRARGDGFYRSMAESALRAMLNPRCQPLPLPLNKYSEWRDMVIFFDPREMF